MLVDLCFVHYMYINCRDVQRKNVANNVHLDRVRFKGTMTKLPQQKQTEQHQPNKNKQNNTNQAKKRQKTRRDRHYE